MNTEEHCESRRNIYCWLGFVIGFVGVVTRLFSPGFGVMLVLTALILSVVGCDNWARSKRRHPLFCLWGLLEPVGFLGLAVLQDRY